MCSISDSYGVMTVFNSRTRPRVNRVYSWRGHVISTLGCNAGKVGWVGIRLTRAQFTTEQQPVLRPVVAFSKTSFKHR